MGSGSGAGNIGHVHTHMSHEHTCVPATPREHMSHECTHIQRHARTHTSRGHAHTHTAPGHTRYMNARAHTHIYTPTRERTPRARSCEQRRRQHEDRKTQEAGEEMRPKFRGRGAGLRPGQGCPRTGVCAGRADHPRPAGPRPVRPRPLRAARGVCVIALEDGCSVTSLPGTGPSPTISKSTGRWG